MFTPHKHVMCHMSLVTCHMSQFFFFFFSFFGQIGEAYQWRVCYQRALPCLVFLCFHHNQGILNRHPFLSMTRYFFYYFLLRSGTKQVLNLQFCAFHKKKLYLHTEVHILSDRPLYLTIYPLSCPNSDKYSIRDLT